MKSKTKKIIFFSIALLALVAGATGYYMYQKGPVNVRNAKGVVVEADALYRLYVTDIAQAQELYDQKVLQVSGVVASVSTNIQNEQVVLLKVSDEKGFINCTMDETILAKSGESIVLKGVCSGIGESEPDMDIYGDVYLSRAILSK